MAVVIAAEAYGFLGARAAPAPQGFTTTHTVTQGLCGGRNVAASLAYLQPHSVPVGSFAGVGSYLIQVTVDTVGQVCDLYGEYAAMRHENVTLSVQDLTHPFNGTDLLIATLDVEAGPLLGSSGFSWSVPTKASVSQLLPGNAFLLGTADVEWVAQIASHLNLTFAETIFTDAASAFLGDTLRFTLTVRFVVDNAACFGGCWSPFFDEAFTATHTFDATVTLS